MEDTHAGLLPGDIYCLWKAKQKGSICAADIAYLLDCSRAESYFILSRIKSSAEFSPKRWGNYKNGRFYYYFDVDEWTVLEQLLLTFPKWRDEIYKEKARRGNDGTNRTETGK